MGYALLVVLTWAMIAGVAWVLALVAAVLGALLIILFVVALLCYEIRMWWISRGDKRKQSSGTV